MKRDVCNGFIFYNCFKINNRLQSVQSHVWHFSHKCVDPNCNFPHKVYRALACWLSFRNDFSSSWHFSVYYWYCLYVFIHSYLVHRKNTFRKRKIFFWKSYVDDCSENFDDILSTSSYTFLQVHYVILGKFYVSFLPFAYPHSTCSFQIRR